LFHRLRFEEYCLRASAAPLSSCVSEYVWNTVHKVGYTMSATHYEDSKDHGIDFQLDSGCSDKKSCANV
ncbi:hypothetical protein T11_14032, partial [Trichinella zimbabwensis]